MIAGDYIGWEEDMVKNGEYMNSFQHECWFILVRDSLLL